MEPIGKEISTILADLEETLWLYEARKGAKPNYNHEAIRSVSKVFASVVFDKMWELQEREGMTLTERGDMATAAGGELRSFVKKFTDIDLKEFYTQL